MSGEFSREALREFLGDELFAYTQQVARDAPTPSPEAIDRARRLFAPAAALLAAKDKAATRTAPAVAQAPDVIGRAA